MSATPTPSPEGREFTRQPEAPDTTKTSPEAPASEQGTAPAAPSGGTEQPKSFTLNLPMVTMQFHPPHLSKARLQQRAQAQMLKAQAAAAQATTHAPKPHMPKAHMPRPEHVAYYGGLGALALLEMIEWPVAAAIGVGTAVAERVSRTPGAQPGAQPGAEPGAEPGAQTQPGAAARPGAVAQPSPGAVPVTG